MNKSEKYQLISKQIASLLDDDSQLISDLANVTDLLKETFDLFWIGFYFMDKDKNLYLGPFQGPVACTKIELGKGVCGTSAKEQRTIIVPDVLQFPGHIACNTASKSEIVVPLIFDSKCQLILDIDSTQLNDFSEVDQIELESIIEMITEKHFISNN